MSILRNAILVFAVAGALNVAQANCGSCGASKEAEHSHEHAACTKCAHAKACTAEDCADKAHKAACTCAKKGGDEAEKKDTDA